MHDVVVVGARCAGAATALLLARQGHRVLMVDQAHFPSDVKLSTHLLWHAGVDLLDTWGVLNDLRASNCPELRDFALDLGEMVLKGTPPDTRVGAAMAPKRIVLDQILLNAATQAGAELQEGVSFEDVMRDPNGRVSGVRVRTAEGDLHSHPARLVVGADGSHSHVARAVGAQTRLAHDKAEGSYNVFAYFSDLPLQGVEFYSRPERMVYAWQTNDGQAMVGIIYPGHATRASKADLDATTMADLAELAPPLSQRLAQARRETEWVHGAIGSFAKEAAGPGWALVGDAGLTVDPITAAGITHALRDAQLLAELAHEGLSEQRPLDEALQNFEPRRNAVSLPLHGFAQEMAKLAPPTPEVMALFGALHGNQPQIDRYFGVFGQTVSPADFFSPENLQAIAQAAQPAAA